MNFSSISCSTIYALPIKIFSEASLISYLFQVTYLSTRNELECRVSLPRVSISVDSDCIELCQFLVSNDHIVRASAILMPHSHIPSITLHASSHQPLQNMYRCWLCEAGRTTCRARLTTALLRGSCSRDIECRLLLELEWTRLSSWCELPGKSSIMMKTTFSSIDSKSRF